MRLRTRFSLALALVFLLSLVIAGAVSYVMLHRQAREVVEQRIELLMSTARAIRSYTVSEVRPNLAKSGIEDLFKPQSVPAYAAIATLGRLPDRYAEYSYREAANNPTNPKDKAEDWEAEIIRRFQADASLQRLVGERPGKSGPVMYVAHPIRITDKACLACHSDPDIAPPSLLKKYGAQNGFGWKMNEVVAAQIGAVPAAVPIARANQAILVFVGLLAAVFLLVFLVLNWMLSRLIVNPITRMANDADKVSTGDFNVEEFPEAGDTEVGRLGLSFNRMRRSLEQAMRMIDR
jgi:HAMP domain-containing protein